MLKYKFIPLHDLFSQLVQKLNFFLEEILLNDQYQLDVDQLIIDIDLIIF